MSDQIMMFTDDNFDKEVLQSSIPVMVDFWAEWCGPCRMLAPIVEEVAKEFNGKLKVGKLNVDDNPKSASRYNVMSIPTLVFFKQGKENARSIGVIPKSDVKRRVEVLLG